MADLRSHLTQTAKRTNCLRPQVCCNMLCKSVNTKHLAPKSCLSHLSSFNLSFTDCRQAPKVINYTSHQHSLCLCDLLQSALGSAFCGRSRIRMWNLIHFTLLHNSALRAGALAGLYSKRRVCEKKHLRRHHFVHVSGVSKQPGNFKPPHLNPFLASYSWRAVHQPLATSGTSDTMLVRRERSRSLTNIKIRSFLHTDAASSQ